MSILPYLFWFHLIGVSIWVGASLIMPLIIAPALQGLEGPARMKAMGAISQRMMPIITVAIILVFASGIWQTAIKYGGFSVFMAVNVLTIKVFVAILMAVNGFYMGVALPRRAAALAPAPGAPPTPEFMRVMRLTVMHGWVQFGLAVVILLVVGFLTAG